MSNKERVMRTIDYYNDQFYGNKLKWKPLTEKPPNCGQVSWPLDAGFKMEVADPIFEGCYLFKINDCWVKYLLLDPEVKPIPNEHWYDQTFENPLPYNKVKGYFGAVYIINTYLDEAIQEAKILEQNGVQIHSEFKKDPKECMINFFWKVIERLFNDVDNGLIQEDAASAFTRHTIQVHIERMLKN